MMAPSDKPSMTQQNASSSKRAIRPALPGGLRVTLKLRSSSCAQWWGRPHFPADGDWDSSLEALPVHDGGARLIVLALGDPHLLESAQRGEDGTIILQGSSSWRHRP